MQATTNENLIDFDESIDIDESVVQAKDLTKGTNVLEKNLKNLIK